MKLQVVPQGGNRFEVRRFGTRDTVAEGSRESCIAAARLLSDEWEIATCITPNGRTDGHGKFVNVIPGQGLVCSFCKGPIK